MSPINFEVIGKVGMGSLWDSDGSCPYCNNLERHPIEDLRSNYQGIAWLNIEGDWHFEKSGSYQPQICFYDLSGVYND